MKDSLHIIRVALEDLWDNAFMVIFCSLVWLFLVMLIVPGPPATLVLFEIADRLVKKDHLLEFRDYLRSVWRRFGAGWRWGLVNLVVAVIVLVDIRTIPRMFPPSIAVPVQLAFYLALAVWIVVNLYALAFLFQQKEMQVRLALRNGSIMLLRHPLFSLVLALSTTVLLWLSLVVVIVNLLFGPMFIALVGTRAVEDRLAFFREAKNAQPAE